MANHVRQQLREAIATALTGLTTTGANVFQSRVYAMQDTGLPGLVIRTDADEVVERTIGGATRSITRDVSVVVQGMAKATANLDDTLDTIAKEVETALAAGVTVGGKVHHLRYERADITLAGEGEQPTGSIEMQFLCSLSNAANAPDVLT